MTEDLKIRAERETRYYMCPKCGKIIECQYDVLIHGEFSYQRQNTRRKDGLNITDIFPKVSTGKHGCTYEDENGICGYKGELIQISHELGAIIHEFERKQYYIKQGRYLLQNFIEYSCVLKFQHNNPDLLSISKFMDFLPITWVYDFNASNEFQTIIYTNEFNREAISDILQFANSLPDAICLMPKHIKFKSIKYYR